MDNYVESLSEPSETTEPPSDFMSEINKTSPEMCIFVNYYDSESESESNSDTSSSESVYNDDSVTVPDSQNKLKTVRTIDESCKLSSAIVERVIKNMLVNKLELIIACLHEFSAFWSKSNTWLIFIQISAVKKLFAHFLTQTKVLYGHDNYIETLQNNFASMPLNTSKLDLVLKLPKNNHLKYISLFENKIAIISIWIYIDQLLGIPINDLI